MTKFKNLKDVMKYIERATEEAMPELGEELENIMKEEIQTQVYDAYKPQDYVRQYELLDSVETTNVGKDYVQVSWRNNGSWTSYAGKPMYVIHGLEMGKTYGVGGYRPSTNLVEDSKNRASDELPEKYKEILKSKGIKVR